jgi:hypothetical protein
MNELLLGFANRLFCGRLQPEISQSRNSNGSSGGGSAVADDDAEAMMVAPQRCRTPSMVECPRAESAPNRQQVLC